MPLVNTNIGSSQATDSSLLANDVHSRLNATGLREQVKVSNLEDLQRQIGIARRTGAKICTAGGRHAMGGQQLLTAGTLFDTTSMDRVLDFDQVAGTIEVEAGIKWPGLIEFLKKNGSNSKGGWSIAQKQTGCDNVTLGGALSSNVHGRGLRMKPIVADVESFDLVMADGSVRHCSRSVNPDLFRLAVGGYGLFGVIHNVRLRLAQRSALRRHVEIATAENVIKLFETRIHEGFQYGDFQFAIDSASDDFLYKGVFSAYRPEDYELTELAKTGLRFLSEADWLQLLCLAHSDKSRAFQKYADHYLKTDGQLYASDTFQLGTYIERYHQKVDAHCNAPTPGSEIITELYVPRDKLGLFLSRAANFLRHRQANVIYGTVRLIERDDETFLPWAKQDYACTVLNLHTDHSTDDLRRSAETFRGLIDIATELNGSFYLTYHRYASMKQVLRCYPQFLEFLDKKVEHDPEELFLSDWYLHYRRR